jgi:hypothetical protein
MYGNIAQASVNITVLNRIPVVCMINYTPATFTNQNVVATLAGCNKPITVTNNGGSLQYPFSTNGDFTFEFMDSYGNTGAKKAEVNWIDKTVPNGVLSYSTTGRTNQNIIVTLTTTKPVQPLSGRVEYLSGIIFTKSYSGNLTETLTLTDSLGNTGQVMINIANIDKIAPICGTRSYVPTTATSGNVIATLSGSTDLGGSLIHRDDVVKPCTLTGNVATCSVMISDYAGNTTLCTSSTVSNIDRIPPTCSIHYSIIAPTNQSVMALLTGCSETVMPFPQSQQLLTNGTGMFSFADAAGNTGATTYAVHWIDKNAPQAISLTYAPQVFTTGGVTATLITDEVVFLPIGWSGAATGTTFTKWYTENVNGTVVFSDLVGNQGSTGILITRTDEDSDGDGVPDYIEKRDGTDPADANDYKDSDGDGVPDYVEERDGTDPTDANDYKDSDGDGVPDYIEERDGTDPTDANDYKDSDGDSVPDYTEERDGTNPTDSNDYKDSDGDGVPDYVEEREGTDATDANDYKDSDGDGVPDYIEEREGTDSTDANDYKDSDGDAVPDYIEEREGTDSTDANDYKDSDGDSVPDYTEEREGTNSTDANDYKDSDGDSVPDYTEDRDGTDSTDPNDYKDSDGNGVPDYVEEKEGTDLNDPNSYKDSDVD